MVLVSWWGASRLNIALRQSLGSMRDGGDKTGGEKTPPYDLVCSRNPLLVRLGRDLFAPGLLLGSMSAGVRSSSCS